MLPHMAVNFLTNRVVFRRIGEGFQQLREDGNITQVLRTTRRLDYGVKTEADTFSGLQGSLAVLVAVAEHGLPRFGLRTVGI